MSETTAGCVGRWEAGRGLSRPPRLDLLCTKKRGVAWTSPATTPALTAEPNRSLLHGWIADGVAKSFRSQPSMTAPSYYSVSIWSWKAKPPRTKECPMVQVVDQVLEPEAAPDAIEATLNYIVDDGTKVFTETAAPGKTDVRTGGKPDPRRVTIRNGRRHAGEFTFERNGFRFVHHDTAVGDFFDEAQVRHTYYAEMEALVKAESGASRVVVFDHTLRTADDALREAHKIR